MIEILTRGDPFPGMAALEVAIAVGSKGVRHPIPEETPQWLHDLLQSCWNENPDERPDFTTIHSIVTQHSVE